MADVGGTEIMESISYPAAGADDWVPYAQKLIDSGATSFSWIGEPVFFAKFLETARQRGWEGTALLETNMLQPGAARRRRTGDRGDRGAHRRSTRSRRPTTGRRPPTTSTS